MAGGFGSYLKEIFNDPVLSDVTFVLDNDDYSSGDAIRYFHGHRVVLATMSDYFKTMLYGSFVEAGQREIRLLGVPYSAFERCMKFAYFGWPGWPSSDSFITMSLEEAEQFFGLSRMLLLDSKLRIFFSKWLHQKIEQWEKQIWSILILGIEFQMKEISEKCIALFTDIANECFGFESFGKLPIEAMHMIVACKLMNCSKAELMKAIRHWIALNSASLSQEDKLELLHKGASRRLTFYKGNKLSLYSKNKVKEKLEALQDDGTKTTEPPERILSSPQEYSFTTILDFQKCTMLTGVIFFFESNKKFGPKYEKVQSDLDLEFEINYTSTHERRYRSYNTSVEVLCQRVIHLTYDLTQSSTHKVKLFFPAVKCCARTQVKIVFNWVKVGVQPCIRSFGAFSSELATASSSHVSHLYHRQVSSQHNGYCRSCPSESYDEYDEESDSSSWYVSSNNSASDVSDEESEDAAQN